MLNLLDGKGFALTHARLYLVRFLAQVCRIPLPEEIWQYIRRLDDTFYFVHPSFRSEHVDLASQYLTPAANDESMEMYFRHRGATFTALWIHARSYVSEPVRERPFPHGKSYPIPDPCRWCPLDDYLPGTALVYFLPSRKRHYQFSLSDNSKTWLAKPPGREPLLWTSKFIFGVESRQGLLPLLIEINIRIGLSVMFHERETRPGNTSTSFTMEPQCSSEMTVYSLPEHPNFKFDGSHFLVYFPFDCMRWIYHTLAEFWRGTMPEQALREESTQCSRTPDKVEYHALFCRDNCDHEDKYRFSEPDKPDIVGCYICTFERIKLG